MTKQEEMIKKYDLEEDAKAFAKKKALDSLKALQEEIKTWTETFKYVKVVYGQMLRDDIKTVKLLKKLAFGSNNGK